MRQTSRVTRRRIAAARRSPATRALLACLLLLPAAGCGGDDADASGGDPTELTVLAASSLTDVYEELATGFEEENDAEVTFSFGSSTDLAEQAADGAPGDVLATADRTSIGVAEDAGVTGDVVEFASNVLVLVTPADNPAGVTGLDDLGGTTWVRCADDAPCGRVALAVLDGAGVTAEPASLEEDVRSTLDKVTSGEADAGLVYATDAVAAGHDVATVEIPGADQQPTSYFTATLSQAGDTELAQAWVDYVTSESGRTALAEAGFTLP
jgi:molybdate transport system substrate-binding protein